MQLCPEGHSEQDTRVWVVPPAVCDPAAHVAQDAAPTPEYFVSTPQSTQLAAPPTLYVPAPHDVTLLVPSHTLPAVHTVHAVRVPEVPPDVDDPDAQVVHTDAPAADHSESLPHPAHVLPPLVARNLPAAQGVAVEVPSQRDPTSHSPQVVRVVEEAPPDVVEPLGHTVQESAVPAALYLLSFPHETHVDASAMLKVPASQGVTVDEPSHRLPAVHDLHSVRVVVVPPLVYEPDAQLAHAAAPLLLYFLSSPHPEQLLLPEVENSPAEHWTTTLLPEHTLPAGHGEHVLRLLAVPPLVNEPVAHALHASAPSADHFFSSPQGRHPAVPAAE